MSNVVYINTYKLKEGLSASDFMIAAERLNNEFISKQKGYISLTFLADGDDMVDLLVFESMEDLMVCAKSLKKEKNTDLADKFYSFIDDLDNCKGSVYTVEKDFKK